MPWATSTKGVSPSVMRGRAISATFNTTAGSNCQAYQVAVVTRRYVIQRRRRREECRRAVARGHWSLPVATGRRAVRSCRHVGPFYGASVYSCSLYVTAYGSFIRRSTCGSYRIAIFCLISYRIYRFLLWLYRAITNNYCIYLNYSCPVDNSSVNNDDACRCSELNT